jgi:hypothetical protein
MQTVPARRQLDFHDFDAVIRDVESLAAGGYERCGRWDLAQVCRHLAEWLRFPLDGYPKPPAPIRLMLWTLRKTIGKRELRKILESRQMPGGGPTLPETVPSSGGIEAEAVEDLRRIAALRPAWSRGLHAIAVDPLFPPPEPSRPQDRPLIQDAIREGSGARTATARGSGLARDGVPG